MESSQVLLEIIRGFEGYRRCIKKLENNPNIADEECEKNVERRWLLVKHYCCSEDCSNATGWRQEHQRYIKATKGRHLFAKEDIF